MRRADSPKLEIARLEAWHEGFDKALELHPDDYEYALQAAEWNVASVRSAQSNAPGAVIEYTPGLMSLNAILQHEYTARTQQLLDLPGTPSEPY